MEKKLVITINRQHGSRGRGIAKLLSKELGIPVYDEKILTKASEESAISEELFRKHDETPGNRLLYKIVGGVAKSLGKPDLDGNVVSPDNLFRFQSEVIRDLAEQESCILVGRCSDFVLRSAGMDDFISLFIYADDASKIRTFTELYGVDPAHGLEEAFRINKKRSDYYRYYTGEEWESMEHYDLPINTSKITDEQAITLIKDYLKIRGYDI